MTRYCRTGTPSWLLTLFAIYFLASVSCTCSGQDLLDEYDQAVQNAVARIVPALVKIEGLGGQEKVGDVIVGTGPTTGLIVSSDGYIISSAFNFAQKPASILVTLPNGKRNVAQLVAQDHSRMLVLLKVSTEEPLVFPNALPRSQMEVGQTTIAVGRTFDSTDASVSVGVLSAVNRIWGKAIQTDAKVSPANYGGPLIDLSGNVLGILVPMSTQAMSEVAGAELYDSGIGFAVPLTDVYRNLDRMKMGQSLYPGLLGVAVKGNGLFDSGVIIGACGAKSPAYKSGVRAGDRIIELNGRSVRWQAELKHELGPMYSGDHVQMVVMRADERIEANITLAEKIEPYEHAFVGILPNRDSNAATVVVRYVFADSGAARAGLLTGDQLESVNRVPLATPAAFREQIASLEPGNRVTLGVRRADQPLEVEVELGRLPINIPTSLPPARIVMAVPNDRPPVGLIEIKLPEDEHNCQAYVPENFNPEVKYGLVVWLHPPGGYDEKQLMERWKTLCEQHDLIVIAPQAADPNRWLPTEIAFIRKAVDQLSRQYPVDATRVVAHGHQAGGTLGYLLAFEHRDLIRAVAAVDAPVPLRMSPPDNEPLQRLAVYSAQSTKSKFAAAIVAGVQRLQSLKYPVHSKTLHEPTYLDADELAELVRWIDCLDCI